MAKAIAINLLLLDGTANGRIQCSSKSRTGIILKIPRKDLEKCNDREELKNNGVYFLLGEKEIYVGQASSRKNGNGILARLKEHDCPQKKFWTEAIVLTTLTDSFGATEISWLENRFYNMAIKAACYTVKNSNDPSPGNPSEEQKIELEAHAEFAQLVLSAIGYKIFKPLLKVEPSPKIKQTPKVEHLPEVKIPLVMKHYEEIFYLKRYIKKLGRKVNAQMKITPTGYRVLAGSEVFPLLGKDNSSRLIKKRRQAASVDANNKLLKDEEFSSPSSAAEFVLGNTANGLTEWHTKDGVTFEQFFYGR